MNTIANRTVICNVLMEHAKNDRDIVVLCSDSRGSASMTPFANAYPEQFIEIGIAEQNLVGISAGLAKCGKKAYACSPACFISSRSYEQIKIDCAYSNTNVKLIGISGGVSYGALGMSHHSLQDIAAIASLPNMKIYLPSDRFQTRFLTQQLLQDNSPAYIRVGRNPVEDVYDENYTFEKDKAVWLKTGNDITIIACGEMVKSAYDAAILLNQEGISVTVLDMYCLKPIDEYAIIEAAKCSKAVVTVEEHSAYGGLGSMVSSVVSRYCPKKVLKLSLPDSPIISGTSKDIFAYYGLDAHGIKSNILTFLEE